MARLTTWMPRTTAALLPVVLVACSASAPRLAGPAPSAATAAEASSVARCHTSMLSLALAGRNRVAADQYEVRLVFTNEAARPCRLAGFPGVDLKGPPSRQGDTYSLPRSAGVPRPAVLPPGASVRSVVTYLAGPGACDPGGAWTPDMLVVTPPDETTQLTAPWPGQPVDHCQAGATHPGTYVAPIEPT